MILVPPVERAVERRNDCRSRINPLAQTLFRAADLALPGQECEDGAGVGSQRALDGIRHAVFEALRRILAEIARLDGEAAPFARNHRRTAQ